MLHACHDWLAFGHVGLKEGSIVELVAGSITNAVERDASEYYVLRVESMTISVDVVPKSDCRERTELRFSSLQKVLIEIMDLA